MARLEGEKKSVVPLIVGAVLLAALAAGAYAYFSSRGSGDTSNANGPTPAMSRPSSAVSGNSGADNSSADNSGALNEAASNTASGNEASGGTSDNSASATGGTNNLATENFATGTENSATTTENSAAGSSNSAASTNSAAGSGSAMMGKSSTSSTTTTNGTPHPIAARSKTIKKGDTTVTYRKEVLGNGAQKHTKTTTTGDSADAGATSAP